MKLYKFRSLQQIELTLDILLHQRLYCAEYKDLNDPLEGIFFSVLSPPNFPHSILSSKTVEDLPTYKKDIKICSLSESLSDIRMWSHYANGHEGVAIEIDFRESEDKLNKVKYYPGIQKLSSTILGDASPEEVLSIKTNHWEYEKEHRIISRKTHFPIIGKIKALYLGIRISELHKEILLKAIPIYIPIFETKLDKKRVIIKPNKSINRTENTSALN